MAQPLPPRGPQAILEQLDRQPDYVIDIGVRRGTPWLYNAFPDVPHVLVDPQHVGETVLDHKPNTYVFVQKAVGDALGRLTFNEQGLKSTFLNRTELTMGPQTRTYEVDVVTLDTIIDEYCPDAQRIFLKIDTEGYEVPVIRGLNRHRDKIDAVIAEASVMNRFKQQQDFPEVLWEFYQKGFRFYNMFDPLKRPTALVYDCIFFQKEDEAFNLL